jgi:hypothetical protein
VKKIIWIASYPKSGNTWLRAIVSSMLYTAKGSFNFDLLKLIQQFDKIERYKYLKELNIKDFNKINNNIKNISKHWIDSQKKIFLDNKINPIYNIFKTHSANLNVNTNQFTNINLSAGCIYIVRDPREVTVSFSKHFNKSYDETVDFITNKNSCLSPLKKGSLVLVSSWDINYQSWKISNIPTLFIKYENVLKDSEKEILKIYNFLNILLELNKENIDHMVKNIAENTKIEIFRNHEKKFKFSEKSKFNNNFFGDAKSDSWKEKLSKFHISKIEEKFEKTLIDLEYL